MNTVPVNHPPIHVLNEVESRKILKEYAVPHNKSAFAKTKEETIQEADKMEFPVVLKVVSPLIVHKSDFGGVQINLQNIQEVEEAFDLIYENAKKRGVVSNGIEGVIVQEMIEGKEEILVGIKRDPIFGPVLVVGLGGVFVELLKDVSLGIAPLEENEILNMLKKLKAYPLLNGYRGKEKLDIDALVQLCKKVVDMAIREDGILEMDLNPVILREEGKGAIAVDARIVLQEK
ncbi:acetate--CoA ligase family protein [Planococcus salinus]|nr:acetate--CoA ligase family protein [Planococcus salinus]